ncbi:hypothetical protein Lepil_2119 [Leptonema illini DSM 21528]|uniref:Uncharacterized protein n=1 Tax=Leptonema illini DSM 21528 TaxID=929563 RepID=H2CFU8_9LEPT|nr:hypothetical protein Lepil_2119 [Leptonema illini DSM 21528]
MHASLPAEWLIAGWVPFNPRENTGLSWRTGGTEKIPGISFAIFASFAVKNVFLVSPRSQSPPRLTLFATITRENSKNSTTEATGDTEKSRERVVEMDRVKFSGLFLFRAFRVFRGLKNPYSSLCLPPCLRGYSFFSFYPVQKKSKSLNHGGTEQNR